jgi:hypothetical protein
MAHSFDGAGAGAGGADTEIILFSGVADETDEADADDISEI